MNSREQCTRFRTIEDPICVLTYRCELPRDHREPHRTTYPGIEGDHAQTVFWTDEDERTNPRTEFVRDGSRKDRDLVQKS